MRYLGEIVTLVNTTDYNQFHEVSGLFHPIHLKMWAAQASQKETCVTAPWSVKKAIIQNIYLIQNVFLIP